MYSVVLVVQKSVFVKGRVETWGLTVRQTNLRSLCKICWYYSRVCCYPLQQLDLLVLQLVGVRRLSKSKSCPGKPTEREGEDHLGWNRANRTWVLKEEGWCCLGKPGGKPENMKVACMPLIKGSNFDFLTQLPDIAAVLKLCVTKVGATVNLYILLPEVLYPQSCKSTKQETVRNTLPKQHFLETVCKDMQNPCTFAWSAGQWNILSVLVWCVSDVCKMASSFCLTSGVKCQNHTPETVSALAATVICQIWSIQQITKPTNLKKKIKTKT